MSLARWINSAGLLLDIGGATLLYFFGLPAEIRRGGTAVLLLEQTNPEEDARARRYDCWARIGLGSLVLGFVCQLASNFL